MKNGITNDEKNSIINFIDNITIKLEYADGKKAGAIAKEYNVAVGEIGCKSCGVTAIGAIMQNKCMWCGENLI